MRLAVIYFVVKAFVIIPLILPNFPYASMVGVYFVLFFLFYHNPNPDHDPYPNRLDNPSRSSNPNPPGVSVGRFHWQ